jgi:hypothetical protein
MTSTGFAPTSKPSAHFNDSGEGGGFGRRPAPPPRRSGRQADALEINALAKRRLADEYDAAQERGEVGKSFPTRELT